MELIYLFLAHHIGDVWAQPSWLIENKKKHLFAIFEHVMVYTAVITITLHLLGVFAFWKLFFILVGHFLIDATKYQWLPKRLREQYWLIYPDQILHYTQLIVVFLL